MNYKSLLLMTLSFSLAIPFGATNYVKTDIKAPNYHKKAIDKSKIDLKSLKGDKVLRLLNWEDYIYLNDPDNGYYEKDLTDQFVDYIQDVYGVSISVEYSTTDTNETMLNELATGKAKFDLICPSDYGIQKLMASDSLVKISDKMLNLGLNNYQDYASPKLIEYLESITAETNIDGKAVQHKVSDYAVGYMWGTLGIIFNPEFQLYMDRDEDFSPYQMLKDMSDWANLWNPKYYGGISIKDSVRDTYFIGLAEVEREPLIQLGNQFVNHEIDAKQYNEQISHLLNQSDPKTTDKVLEKLKELKQNIFGLEVDSGKQDIVTGKVGINTAWSGDAVYSMDLADAYNDENGIEYEFGLHYAVPTTVANIWFDGWCMPKDDARSEMQETLALLFLDFISDPINAAQNTNYIGYTPFIGGDSMLDLMKDWYDARTDLIYNYDEENDEWYSLFYLEDGVYTEVWYEDVHFQKDSDPNYDDVELYYAIENEQGQYGYDEENCVLLTYDESSMEDWTRYDIYPYVMENNQPYTYNGLLIIDPEWDVVDLSYFFDGTLSEYTNSNDDNFDSQYNDMVFYAYDYYAKDEDGNVINGVGRQFYCQFPDEKTMDRCVVMADFGANNTYVVKMWEDFKANDIEVWMIVVFCVLVGGLLTTFLYFYINKKLNKRLRKLRRQNNDQQM